MSGGILSHPSRMVSLMERICLRCGGPLEPRKHRWCSACGREIRRERDYHRGQRRTAAERAARPPRRTQAERFFAKVDADGDCWVWQGGTSKGYGVFRIRTKTPKAQTYSHRFIWELLVGPIPAGKQIDHLCRNTLCVNPDHLEAVDPLTNMRRGFGPVSQRSRLRPTCANGHERTPEIVRVLPSGALVCRLCEVDYRRRYQEKVRSEK